MVSTTRKRKLSFRIGIAAALAGTVFAAISVADTNISTPADTLIQFLNQTINFYHQNTIQQQIATNPEEQILYYDNRQLADQAVQFAFDFARAQADSLTAQPASTSGTSGGSGGQDSGLNQMLANLDKQVQDTQAEADADRQKLAGTSGSARAQLQSEVSELQGEIALAQARRDAVSSMLGFVNGSATSGMGASGLKAQIDALAASVPAANASAGSTPTHAEPPPAAPIASQPAGIWELAADLFGLSSKMHDVDSMIAQTNALERTSDELRAPFITQMQELSKNGDQLAAQADHANSAVLTQEKQQLDTLASQFKQISAAVIPLAKQRILLNLYEKNLTSWRDLITEQYKSDLRNLGVRLGLLALVIAVLIGFSELWRRAVYRYVHDIRRRHQFLLLRKLALWAIIALMVAGTVAGKLGSFFTFAGLLTAGVAVALQNVIVSVVGYFFLIGKFGIRVGDRVEVSGTSGEVIDIGLVRFHLMELSAGAMPTGRVVAFSNSVVFQSSAGLFKHIPGATFAWHQVTVTIPREADFSAIKKDLLDAVEEVLQDHREDLERLYGEMERRGILFSERGLHPKIELNLKPEGIEATIHYPVDLQHASDIDARISRVIMNTLGHTTETHPAGQKVS